MFDFIKLTADEGSGKCCWWRVNKGERNRNARQASAHALRWTIKAALRNLVTKKAGIKIRSCVLYHCPQITATAAFNTAFVVAKDCLKLTSWGIILKLDAIKPQQ